MAPTSDSRAFAPLAFHLPREKQLKAEEVVEFVGLAGAKFPAFLITAVMINQCARDASIAN
jgi:hypothetical protein